MNNDTNVQNLQEIDEEIHPIIINDFENTVSDGSLVYLGESPAQISKSQFQITEEYLNKIYLIN